MSGTSSGRSSLAGLPLGKSAYVAAVEADGSFRRRLMDLGFVPGSRVSAVLHSPDGGVVSYRIKGADIALRREDAASIRVSSAVSMREESGSGKVVATSGPLWHGSGGETPAAPGRAEPVVALAGNPNTGKSTVFNALTGLRQHVGNWPGKTVAKLEGTWSLEDRTVRVVDLPGAYSLLSNSPEEEIARDFILTGQPDCVVVVADATCLERNLNLAFQIMEITPRVVLCVNLIDQARGRGVRIDGARLEELLGVPVVMTCAHNAGDIKRLGGCIERVVSRRCAVRPARVRYGARIEQALSDIGGDVGTMVPGVASRWVAMRLVDGADARVREWVANGGRDDSTQEESEAERASRTAYRA